MPTNRYFTVRAEIEFKVSGPFPYSDAFAQAEGKLEQLAGSPGVTIVSLSAEETTIGATTLRTRARLD